MKKYLFVALLLLCAAGVSAQSITVNDLTSISNLSNADAHNYLVLGKGFKRQYLQDVDGNTVEHMHKTGQNKETGDKMEETVVVGVGTKLSSGTVLRTVTYTSLTTKHIFNLITQAKSLGLSMKFQGADSINNIYLFDNDFFHITMLINRNNAIGSVEVKQKEYLGFD
ncbi:hypothetical protein SAMN05216464_11459 [Mucilaginibacter pineti]|uniref:Uncharacterized protein n=1 Tax=Mucilaginibacter pineti TaxID=1391627 RepID=A0A1G7J592_9SPHI|nr:hypothetical protein [Mucilaginibacter pineti]SDF20028.1 hypothetical protein SAMN05216464_11459 [Mucilaginibacter pineti]